VVPGTGRDAGRLDRAQRERQRTSGPYLIIAIETLQISCQAVEKLRAAIRPLRSYIASLPLHLVMPTVSLLIDCSQEPRWPDKGHEGTNMAEKKSTHEKLSEAGRKGGERSHGGRGSEERQGMSREEAGRKGGEKVAEERGPEFYSEIGSKGGKKVAEERGPEFFREIGHKGGEKVAEERGPEYYREIGHKGGEKVAEERGSEFYQEIGHKGGEIVSEERGREFYQQIGRKGAEAQPKEAKRKGGERSHKND